MRAKIVKMGVLARSEVAQAKQAFLLRDVDLAQDLVRQDEQINKLNRECFQRAVEIGDDVDAREWAMTMMLVARALERIGDNAVDIGEQVAFVVTGLFREFSDASPLPRLSPACGVTLVTHPVTGVQERGLGVVAPHYPADADEPDAAHRPGSPSSTPTPASCRSSPSGSRPRAGSTACSPRPSRSTC